MVVPNLSKYIFGPRLYRIYGLAQEYGENKAYAPNSMESIGNNVLKGIKIMYSIGIYASPLILAFMYRRDYFCMAGCMSLGKLATGIGILLIFAMTIRGIGRATNPTYANFLGNLMKHDESPSLENKESLKQYDFDFWAWPAEFHWHEVEGDDSKPRIQVDRSLGKGKIGPFNWLIGVPCNFLGWFAVHSFGRHVMYPGSTELLQVILAPMLEMGRQKLVLSFKGQRRKIVVRDGNYIDTMFVDRRKRNEFPNGSTLVICCEGNAGLYEIGLPMVALDAGYSVLGWNHPGFAGSSGLPFPPQEQNAVDGVMQYAIHKLGFKQEDIMIYAWSIGGYVGTWAAMNYPEIKGLVLDATFDDILPLALPRMPGFLSGIVKRAIRNNLNLNVADQVCRYPGPVTIIRRTFDEIITTKEGDPKTNRANDLLMKLMKTRYPKLFMNPEAGVMLRRWVNEVPPVQDNIYEALEIEEDLYLGKLVSYIAQNSLSYPLMIGEDWSEEHRIKMLLFLAKKHFINVQSEHNNPLESRYLRVPWAPIDDPSYVQLE